VEIKATNNPYKAGSQYGVFSSLFFIIIMVSVGSIPIMIAVRSNLSRLILTGA
jgi:hypothetical protein